MHGYNPKNHTKTSEYSVEEPLMLDTSGLLRLQFADGGFQPEMSNQLQQLLRGRSWSTNTVSGLAWAWTFWGLALPTGRPLLGVEFFGFQS